MDGLKDTITADLQVAVDRFNSDLAAWEARTQCKANFRWSYSQEGTKKMLIQDISLPVYREVVGDEVVDQVIDIMQRSQAENVTPA